jgi:predicted 3-demethylubiquinone-9 3-methyltransferase (glyoxalase superfamily)
MVRRAATHLMFQGQASAALELYSSTFPSFRLDGLERYRPGESGPEGTIKRADAFLEGHALVVIDSPVKHEFTFTPAMSIFVDFASQEELDSAFGKLAEGGQIFMPIGSYGFSSRFGWCADRFGVSWQLNLQ